ncbi:hypothetical protein JRQ81_012038 [Phrynocephalus forsythii]|uniref:Uncharacterized protein n=1 Tax=Phrynocephalus forsythii TaxID=171643 RepID=A0A9Q0X789_9SAUR|nr:hypothetical protein JRQ81_012038 [Phrynocephalus forsythii]
MNGGPSKSLPEQRPGLKERPGSSEERTNHELLLMDPEGLDCLHPAQRSLRKCFRDLQEQDEVWKRTLAACTPLLASVANLAEQMQALRKVPLEKSPLRSFPDLAGRLGHKQRWALEALLEELHQDKLQELQRVSEAAAARVSAVSLLSQQLGGQPGLAKAFRRSARWPSLADMLEWLLDIEAFYHRTCLEVKLLLLQVRHEDLAGLQALPAAWAHLLQRGQQGLVEGADGALVLGWGWWVTEQGPGIVGAEVHLCSVHRGI